MSNNNLLGEIESLFSDTMLKVESTYKRIEKIEEAAMINAKAHETIAHAIELMAQTFKRVEERQDKLEEVNQELYRTKVGAVTPNVFFMVTGTLCTVIIMGGIWITNTSIEATLTSFKAGKEQAEKLSKAVEEIKAAGEERNGH